jgi:hypothetical protein
MSCGLEILQEPQHALEREGLAGDLREPTGDVARHEYEKEAKSVSVRFDRRWPQPSLHWELVREERLDQRAH